MSVDPSKITIDRISVYKSSLEMPPDMIKDKSAIDGFNFSYSLDSGYNYDDKLFQFRLNTLLVAKDKEEQPLEVKAEVGMEFIFIVDNLPELCIKEKDGKIKVQDELGIVLANIAYSSARGIVYQELSSTNIGGIILPIINPAELLGMKKDKK